MNYAIYDHIISFLTDKDKILYCPQILDTKIIQKFKLFFFDDYFTFSYISPELVYYRMTNKYQKKMKCTNLEIKACFKLFDKPKYAKILFPIFSKHKNIIDCSNIKFLKFIIKNKNYSLIKLIIKHININKIDIDFKIFEIFNQNNLIKFWTKAKVIPYLGFPEQNKIIQENTKIKKKVFNLWKNETQDIEEKIYLVSPYMQYLFYSYKNNPIGHIARKMYILLQKYRISKIPQHISPKELHTIYSEIITQISPIGVNIIKENIFFNEFSEHYTESYIGKYLIKFFTYLIKLH